MPSRRADAVDQEAGRRLQHRRQDVEDRERRAQLGEGDVEFVADEQEERRQNENIDVADEMPGADERNDAHVVCARGIGRENGLRHEE
jgi:hypothetical protein